jgi:DNA topoisomerase-3
VADEHRQIHQACRQANDLDMRQADAVSARIHLDLRAGAAFTRLMTTTLQARMPALADQVISYGELSSHFTCHEPDDPQPFP